MKRIYTLVSGNPPASLVDCHISVIIEVYLNIYLLPLFNLKEIHRNSRVQWGSKSCAHILMPESMVSFSQNLKCSIRKKPFLLKFSFWSIFEKCIATLFKQAFFEGGRVFSVMLLWLDYPLAIIMLWEAIKLTSCGKYTVCLLPQAYLKILMASLWPISIVNISKYINTAFKGRGLANKTTSRFDIHSEICLLV